MCQSFLSGAAMDKTSTLAALAILVLVAGCQKDQIEECLKDLIAGAGAARPRGLLLPGARPWLSLASRVAGFALSPIRQRWFVALGLDC
jgi:hypothetical protein